MQSIIRKAKSLPAMLRGGAQHNEPLPNKVIQQEERLPTLSLSELFQQINHIEELIDIMIAEFNDQMIYIYTCLKYPRMSFHNLIFLFVIT